MINFIKERLYILFLLAIFISLILFISLFQDFLSTDTLIEKNKSIVLFKEKYIFLSFVIALSALVFGISLMVPLTPLVLIIGYYFGTINAIYICFIGQLIGSLLVYLYSRYFFYSFFNDKFHNKFINFREKFNNNSFYYLIALRIVGGIPFTIQCIMCGIFKMQLKTYLLATAIGIVPYIYIFSSIGNAFKSVSDLKTFSIQEIITFEYLSPIILLTIIVFLPKLFKLKIF